MADERGTEAIIIQLGRLISKISSLFHISDVNQTGSDEFRSLRDELNRLEAAIKRAGHIREDPPDLDSWSSKSLDAALENTYKELQSRLQPSFRKIWQRLSQRLSSSTFHSKDLDEITQCVAQSTSLISLHVQLIVGFSSVQAGEKPLSADRSILSDAQEFVISQLCNDENMAFETQIDASHPLCLPGTQECPLQEIYRWICTPDANSIYWHIGAAGSGKSTISRTIAYVLRQRDQFGGSFFFDRTKRQSRGTQSFCLSLAVQLALYQPATASHICEALKADPRLQAKSLSVQFSRLISGCISSAKKRTDNKTPVFIIVDSLDQLVQRDAEPLVELLSYSVRKCPALKLIITASQTIQNALDSKFNNITVHDAKSYKEAETSNRHDVGLYLSYMFKTLSNQYRQSDANRPEIPPPGWPSDSSFEIIQGIATTSYTVAKILLRYIWGPNSSNPVQRLQRILSLYQILPKAQPASLLQSILDDSQNGSFIASSQLSSDDRSSLMGCVGVLQDPLPVTAFASLLGCPSRVVLKTLSKYQAACGTAPSPNSIVAFVPEVHALFSGCGSESDSYHANVRAWQGQMFTNCLRVLSQSIVSKLNINTLGESIQGSGLSVHSEQVCTEVSYACMYWGHHLEESGLLPQSGDKVHDFLKSYLFEWAKQLCLMGLPFESLRILMSLRRKVPPLCDHRISSLLFNSICLLIPFIDEAEALMPPEIEGIVQAQSNSRGRGMSPRNSSEGFPIVSELRTMNARNSVQAVAFAPDSTMIACGTGQKLIQIWSICTGAMLQTLKGHRWIVSCLAFSSDGRLASGSMDHTIKIWQLPLGVAERTLRSHHSYINAVIYSRGCNLIASSSQDKTVKLWSVNQGTLLHTFEHSSWVYTVAFSPNSDYLVSGSRDHAIRIWDIQNGNLMTVLEGHKADVISTAIDISTNVLASGSDDTTLRMWSLVKGHLTATITSHTSPVMSLKFLCEGKRIVSASENGTIQVHSTITNDILYSNCGHEDAINSISLSPDMGLMISGSSDKTLKLWMMADRSRLHTDHGDGSSPRALQLSEHSAEISLLETHTIRTWAAKADAVLSSSQQDDTVSVSSVSSVDLKEIFQMPFKERTAFMAAKNIQISVTDFDDIDINSNIRDAGLRMLAKRDKDQGPLHELIWVQLVPPIGREAGDEFASKIRNGFHLWFLWLDYLKSLNGQTPKCGFCDKQAKVADLLLEWWHYEETLRNNLLMDFFKRFAAGEASSSPKLPQGSYREAMFGLWKQEMIEGNLQGVAVDLSIRRQAGASLAAAHRLAVATVPISGPTLAGSNGPFRVKDPWMPVSLDPCPWLQRWWEGPRSSAHFLWDTQTRMTVENALGQTDYLVISHTWGRWRIEGDGEKVEGVPWLVPRTSLFDVTMLPEILSQFPFEARYIWLDLVCIPQNGSPLQQEEISKQADIFQNAKWATIWFNRIDSWEGVRSAINWLSGDYLLACPEAASTVNPFEGLELDLLAEQTTGWASLSQIETDAFGYSFLHQGKRRRIAPDPWFTSLWTLQEICLRPDMYLCNSKMEVLVINPRAPRAVSMDHIIALFNSRQNDAFERDSLPWAIHELGCVAAKTSVSQVLDMSPVALLCHGDRRHCQDINRAPAIMSALGTTEWFRAYNQRRLQNSSDGIEMIQNKYPLQFVREVVTFFGAVFFASHQIGNGFKKSAQDYSYSLGWRRITSIKFQATMMPFTPADSERSSIMVLPHCPVGVIEHETVKRWVINSDGSVNVQKAGVVASCPQDPNRRAVRADVRAFIPTRKMGGFLGNLSYKDVDLGNWLASFRPGAEKYAISLFEFHHYNAGILLERVYRSANKREFFKFGTFSFWKTAGSHDVVWRLEDVDLRVI